MGPDSFPAFPSEPTPCGTGRLYVVHNRTKLLAYLIADTSLPGAPNGFIVYAFLEGFRVGYWNYTVDTHDLLRVMTAFRCSVDPDWREEPEYRAPGGERPTIVPTYNRRLSEIIANRPSPEQLLEMPDALRTMELDQLRRRPLRMLDDE